MTRTGDSGIFRRFKWILALGAIISPLAQAGIRASVDRTEVPIDESVSFTISSSNTKDGDFDPKFDAQGFEVMNQIRSSKMSFSFNNGTFENGASHQITYILRPTKLGALKIRNIQSNGERAPDITIQVIQENLYKKAAPGEAPPLTGDAKNFFVKAELSKSRVYKGEQIVVSYYLYRRTRANVRDVLQYPNFQGFIREDLEMPILSNRPDFEAVNLGGIPFERALLARYAVYPIKDGKLRIDGFSVRVDYIPKNPGSEDMMEDPFFQFFTQVPLRTGSAKSDPVTVDVLPLPEEGKSAAFTGGVGDFELSAQTDSSQVKANSPLTLRYSLRGKGNTSLIEFPKVNWPADLKLYQSQGKTRNLGQGQQEKTFEVVIVPTKEGPSQIPPVEFEFFNPETRSYQKKTSPSIPVVVLPGDPGAPIRSSESAITDIPGVQSSPAPSTESQSYGSTRAREKQMDAKRSVMGTPLWRWV
ncbi:MAG: protein BatD, partial [Proteobacteria bacterium]|nr:protein BatD [Pseudomonadota bacterium]